MARRVNEEDPDDDKEPVSPPVTRRRGSILTSRYFVFGFLIFGILVLAGSLAFTILSNSGATTEPDADFTVVRRSDWKASPRKDVVLLKTPARFVVVSDTGTEECAMQAQCLAIVYEIQMAHLRKRFFDITYNFLVSSDGMVYEGRGWGVESAPTHIHRRPSLSIGFIGTFTHVAPSPKQLDATQRIIRVGVANAFIDKNYTLVGDIDEKATNSLDTMLDKKLFQEFSRWPHWHTGL